MTTKWINQFDEKRSRAIIKLAYFVGKDKEQERNMLDLLSILDAYESHIAKLEDEIKVLKSKL